MHARVSRVWIKKEETMRLFIAIPIPVGWQRTLEGFQLTAKVGNVAGQVPTRWTARENFHITVRFIGAMDTRCIPGLIDTLRAFSDGVAPFTLPFERFEIATADDPKMIWARFAATDAFNEAVTRCTGVMSAFLKNECNGMQLHNGHSVIPHVTLARLNGRSERHGALEHAAPVPAALTVTTLVLNESKTLSSGSVYKRLATFHLADVAR